ncbi:MFS transporter [Burkholderia sp. WAC0059]|nr:MFS transporter [Burkholderia sp. WAC0059]
MYANQQAGEIRSDDRPLLTREAWGVLAIVTIFWIADGYDTFVLLVTGRPALAELLAPGTVPVFARYLGYLVTVTLAGWATGGILGGLLGDRLGRRRTMLLGVVLYSMATTASALTSTWVWLALARFLTGVGIGAEWGVGTSLLQEVWPEKWRTRGAGLLQAGFSVGGLLVSGLWILLGAKLGLSWRWMYLFGLVPLLIILAVYRHIPESTRWTKSRRDVSAASLFAQPQVRRHMIGALAVSISITGGWWAVTSFLPTFVASLAHDPRHAASLAGWAGALYNFGEIVGCIALGFLAERWGRKPTTIVYLLGSLLIVPVVFAGLGSAQAVTAAQLVSGFFTGGLYSWYAIHTPELFPTRIRATAISVVFSGARYLAMAGAMAAGTLAAALGGFGKVALWFAPVYLLGVIAVLFLPETLGRGLPD